MNIIFSLLPIIAVPKFTVTENSDLLSDKSNVGMSKHCLNIFSVP